MLNFTRFFVLEHALFSVSIRSMHVELYKIFVFVFSLSVCEY